MTISGWGCSSNLIGFLDCSFFKTNSRTCALKFSHDLRKTTNKEWSGLEMTDTSGGVFPFSN